MLRIIRVFTVKFAENMIPSYIWEQKTGLTLLGMMQNYLLAGEVESIK